MAKSKKNGASLRFEEKHRQRGGEVSYGKRFEFDILYSIMSKNIGRIGKSRILSLNNQ